MGHDATGRAPSGASGASGASGVSGASGAGVAPGPAGSAGPGARGHDHSVRLVLWRHGQTRWNAEGRFQGQSDIPLDLVGEQQADRAARLLAALQPTAIYSSDLARATMTAAPLARLTGLTVMSDKDLQSGTAACGKGSPIP